MTQPVTTSGTLASAVIDTGTFTVSYPSREGPEAGSYDEGDFFGAMRHQFVLNGAALNYPKDFDITLGTGSITVTNRTGATWAANSAWRLDVKKQGKALFQDEPATSTTPGNRVARAARATQVLINLGAADALITNGVMAAQNRTNAGALVVNGSLATSGVATMDQPRNVIAKSGGADTAVLTVTGTDEYAQTMSEAITLNGTTAVSGKKAFKKVTAIACSAAVSNSPFLGTGDVLGLPVFLPSAGYVIKELENGTAATAGTFVAGIATAGGSTTTTGDTRGTYDPNSACDADKVFQLVVTLPDPTYRGIAQA